MSLLSQIVTFGSYQISFNEVFKHVKHVTTNISSSDDVVSPRIVFKCFNEKEKDVAFEAVRLVNIKKRILMFGMCAFEKLKLKTKKNL